ncbi:MAG: thiamine pyrophosphate-dependent enzyme [Megasphaera sp.]|jgi:2-oxoglutarate ferredoxin oxidoreductase subunit beta|nr:thiamine pyrophosphate-dependent enzyme [Megasphaera sp.]MCH4188564.1 thiamine pyrophosphate-dependent enzyme [Megasphaera sp.]MCH4218451.1 thiamine pyrophosphate-dependent enzyme [Megasphaera sp.]
MEQTHVYDRLLRQNKLPHIWCPGCGNGIVTNALIRAIDQSGIDPDDIVVVAGVGCSSRANGYLNFCGLHTNHGRPLAYATGVKMANPKLHVIVVTGDGDTASIGGNHFIHACRRNVDITTIVYNNDNYGMTGGQFSPTTPTGAKTKTTVYGNLDTPFDICQLAQAAGATYVSRATTYHVTMLIDQITKGLLHDGFSVIEAMSSCPTLYGRLNKLGSGADMMQHFKDIAVTKKQAATMSDEELADKLVIGTFVERTDRPEYAASYSRMVAAVEGRD